MIAQDQNEALLKVGNAALVNSNWLEYSEYCFKREKGLRKEAFKHLNSFLKNAENWNYEQKLEFVKFLFPFFETVEQADYGPFPYPLSERLVKPTLEDWCKIEIEDSKPFRWYGTYYRELDYLLKALEINPSDDIARQQLLKWWTYNIYFSVHHLPEGYIGDPIEDLKFAEEIKNHINRLTDPKLQEYWTNELEEDLELIRNYVEWKKSGHTNLELWGMENRKRVSYNLSRSYYYDK